MTIYSSNAKSLNKAVPAFARVRDPDRPPTAMTIAVGWVGVVAASLMIGGIISLIILYACGYRIIGIQDQRNIAAVTATLLAAGVESTPLTEEETKTLTLVVNVVMDLLSPPTDTIRLNEVARALSSPTEAPRDAAARHVGLTHLMRRLELVPRERRAGIVDALLVNADAQTQALPLAHILKNYPRELSDGMRMENKESFERVLTTALEWIRANHSTKGAEIALAKSIKTLKERQEGYDDYKSKTEKQIQIINDRQSWISACVKQFNYCTSSKHR